MHAHNLCIQITMIDFEIWNHAMYSVCRSISCLVSVNFKSAIYFGHILYVLLCASPGS